MTHLTIQLITAGVLSVGLVLVMLKRRVGWLVMFVAGFGYLWVYAGSGLWVFIVVQVYFMVINIIGFVKWREG